MYKKILICPDSFKESINSIELTQILSEYLNEYGTIGLAIADGGEGSLSVVNQYKSLEKRSKLVTGPLGGNVKSFYYQDPKSKESFIELATTSGLDKIPIDKRNPSEVNTFGTGELILDALSKGSKTINLFLGGSSSNDAGIGIASALGVKFYSQSTQIHLPKGRDMQSINRIVSTEILHGIQLNIIGDVENPFLGPMGAVNIFAQQKGADETMRKSLELGMENLASLFDSTFGIDIREMKGTGAAGGIAGGLKAMFGASMISGFDYFSDLVNLNEKIREADLVITGEGKLDQQSISSKLVARICTLAKENDKKVFTISGEITLSSEEMTKLGILDSIELKQFGNKLIVNRDNTLLELEACKNTLLKKIKKIL